MDGQFEETERFLFSAYFSEDSRGGIITITFKNILCTTPQVATLSKQRSTEKCLPVSSDMSFPEIHKLFSRKG